MSMTENEAKDCIEQLKHYNLKGKLTTPLNNDISMLWDGAFGIVMDLFEEIQQYRAIGTVEEVKYLVGSYNDMIHDFGDDMDALEQYRAIGTVEDIKALSSMEIGNFNALQKYRAIGTVEEFKALKEKSTPKKPFGGMYDWTCPTCGTYHYTHGKCCSECMQAIDWN